MHFILKKEKGFTIVEIIISILILSIGVVGIFNAFSIVTILTSDSVNRLTANYLAQEGMEIVRNVRDTNWLNMNACAAGGVPSDGRSCPASWVDGLNNCAGGCYADYTATGSIYKPVKPGNIGYLSIDKNGFYSYQQCSQPGQSCASKFQREITITPVTDIDGKSDHIMQVTIQVSWDEKATILNPTGFLASTCGAYNCITTEETLYDWYNYAHQ